MANVGLEVVVSERTFTKKSEGERGNLRTHVEKRKGDEKRKTPNLTAKAIGTLRTPACGPLHWGTKNVMQKHREQGEQPGASGKEVKHR